LPICNIAPQQTTRVTGFALALAGLLAITILLLWPHPDNSLARVQRSGQLRLCLDPSFPPFETTDGAGHYGGFDVALARELAAGLNVTARFVPTAFDLLYEALAADQCDLAISGLIADPTLTQEIAYSLPYFQGGLFLVVRENDAGLQQPGDLAGRTIAVELASTAEGETRRLATLAPGLLVQTVETPDAALDALLAGRADAAIADGATLASYRREHPGLRVLLPPLTDEPYVIASRVKDQTLLQAINRLLTQFQADGTLVQLIRSEL